MVRVVFIEVPRLRSAGAEEQTMYVSTDALTAVLGADRGAQVEWEATQEATAVTQPREAATASSTTAST